MIINTEEDLKGMRTVSEAVALTLRKMHQYVEPGMSTRELDEYGGRLLSQYGARSAPYLVYRFPGHSCISINDEVCHGIPSDKKIIKDGDLVNIDVSAELGGYWSDNGGSVIAGNDVHGQHLLVETSKKILYEAIRAIKAGIKINSIGMLMEKGAKRRGYKVIKNLGGHGVGLGLHEQPDALLNYKDLTDQRRFRKYSVVAIETFINTHSNWAIEQADGFTMTGNMGGFAVQHEHTIVVTDDLPIILTQQNDIWNGLYPAENPEQQNIF